MKKYYIYTIIKKLLITKNKNIMKNLNNYVMNETEKTIDDQRTLIEVDSNNDNNIVNNDTIDVVNNNLNVDADISNVLRHIYSNNYNVSILNAHDRRILKSAVELIKNNDAYRHKIKEIVPHVDLHLVVEKYQSFEKNKIINKIKIDDLHNKTSYSRYKELLENQLNVIKNNIHIETNYDLFEFDQDNRSIKETSVITLMHALSEGESIQIPIVVVQERGKYYILDGQHRFSALKRLGYPILYIDYTDLKNELDLDTRKISDKLNTAVNAYSTRDAAKANKEINNFVMECNKLLNSNTLNIKFSKRRKKNGEYFTEWHEKNIVLSEKLSPNTIIYFLGPWVKKHKASRFMSNQPLTDNEKREIEVFVQYFIATIQGLNGYWASESGENPIPRKQWNIIWSSIMNKYRNLNLIATPERISKWTQYLQNYYDTNEENSQHVYLDLINNFESIFSNFLENIFSDN